MYTSTQDLPSVKENTIASTNRVTKKRGTMNYRLICLFKTFLPAKDSKDSKLMLFITQMFSSGRRSL
jgi:hypothetical protein